MWAVVPVKGFDRGKSRLARVLGQGARHTLCCRLAERTLELLAGAGNVRGVTLVSHDAEAELLAARYGSSFIREEEGAGLNSALAAALSQLQCQKKGPFMVMHADLVYANKDAVERLVDHHLELSEPAVTLVPDYQSRGTNLMLFSGQQEMPFRFGVNSFLAHQKALTEQNLKVDVWRDDRLSFDLDRPIDLARFYRTTPTTARGLLGRTVSATYLAAGGLS